MIRALLLMLLAVGPAWAQGASQGTPPGTMVPLMGKRLLGPGGEELGRLVDVVTDAEGRPVAAVVDVGGFMGLGSRRVALGWALLRFRVDGERVHMGIELPTEAVTAAPEFRPGEAATILDGAPRK